MSRATRVASVMRENHCEAEPRMKRFDRLNRARPRREPAGSTGAVGLEPVQMTLEVSEMGARGDAFAQGQQGPIYVPFSLPGEQVEGAVLADRADIRQILAASPDRIAPVCPHFGRCGGCQLQHWAEAPYLAWKQGQLERALAKRGITAPMVDIAPAWGRGRRRATFHASRAGRAFGFVERGGARINPISACPVLVPELVAALPALKTLLQAFAPARGEATGAALWTDEGLDLDIKGAGRPDAWGRARLEQLGPMAEAADLARLSFDGVLALQRRPPSVRMGRARVEPPAWGVPATHRGGGRGAGRGRACGGGGGGSGGGLVRRDRHVCPAPG